MHKPRTLLVGGLVATSLVLAACGGDDDDAGATTSAAETTAAPTEAPPIVFKPLDAGGPLTYAAIANGDIQIAAVFTTDYQIVEQGLVTLEDDKDLQPVQNLVVVGREGKLTDAVAGVIAPVMAQLTTPELAELNRQVVADKADPKEVAKNWLDGKGVNIDTTVLGGQSFTVGSANFYEQEIVSSIVSLLLQANGADVSDKFKIGSREVVAPALETGEIDLYVEYVGAYLAFLGGTPSPDLGESVTALREAAGAKGVRVLDPTPAENKDGLAVTQETADTYGLSKTSDLATVTDQLTMGGSPECPQRPYCILGYQDVYGLEFEV